MKKAVSCLRFFLLVIGSLFFAMGILVLNACRSANARDRTALSPKKLPAAATNDVGVAGLNGLTTDELIAKLDAASYREREAAQEVLTRRGQEVVPKVGAAVASGNPEIRTRACAILAVLGWHVTRDGKVEAMSDSKEFRQMMRNRLPEMQAE